jgi:hypothetical protein
MAKGDWDTIDSNRGVSLGTESNKSKAKLLKISPAFRFPVPASLSPEQVPKSLTRSPTNPMLQQHQVTTKVT